MAKTKKAASLAPAGSVLASNRKALHEYHVHERLEAGIVLVGSEVKSIKDGRISLVEAFAQFDGDELFMHAAHVAEYTQAHQRNHEPLRKRKLLLKRRELDKLRKQVSAGGMTLIPLTVFAKNGYIKIEIGLCQGKQLHDKRASIKEKELRREMDRALKER